LLAWASGATNGVGKRGGYYRGVVERLENGTQYAKKSVRVKGTKRPLRQRRRREEREERLHTLIGAFCGTSVRAGVKVY